MPLRNSLVGKERKKEKTGAARKEVRPGGVVLGDEPKLHRDQY